MADKLTSILIANRASWLLDVFCLQASPDAHYIQITSPFSSHEASEDQIYYIQSKAKHRDATLKL